MNLTSKSVSEFIADALHDFGVTDIFCVVGGAIAPLSNVFATDSRFKIHYLLHEQSAGIAAESYSASFGNNGVSSPEFLEKSLSTGTKKAS